LRVTDAREGARRGKRAEHGITTDAASRRTDVGLRAGVAVVARRPVGAVRVRAEARRRGAGARDMTRAGRRADHRVGADGGSGGATVGLRAAVPVAAHRAVVREGIRADSRLLVARTGEMTLIEWRTDDRVATDADPGAARVRPRAGAAVGTRRTVRRVRVRA